MTPKTNASHSKHSRHGAPAAKPAKTEKSATSEKNSAARLLGTLGVRLDQEVEDAKKGLKRTGVSPKERARVEAETRMAAQIARQRARTWPGREEEERSQAESEKRQMKARRQREAEDARAMAEWRRRDSGPKDGRLTMQEAVSKLRAAMWRSAERGDNAKLRAQLASTHGAAACRWVDESGCTILMHAAAHGRDCLAALEGAVDIDAQNMLGATALHCAVGKWSHRRPNRAAWWSLAQKSDLSIKDHEGQTAFMRMVQKHADKDISLWIEFMEEVACGGAPSASRAKGRSGRAAPEGAEERLALAEKTRQALSEAFAVCQPRNFESIAKLVKWASGEQIAILSKNVERLTGKQGGQRPRDYDWEKLGSVLEQAEMSALLRTGSTEAQRAANQRATGQEAQALETASKGKSGGIARRRL